MTNNDNVHLKIEVFRDKNTGNLGILAHFDKNSPNIFKDNQGYIWLPTVEEKKLLDETFDLMGNSKTFGSDNKNKTNTDQLENMQTTSTQTPNLEPKEDVKSENQSGEKQPELPEESAPPLEGEEEPQRPLENQLEFTPSPSDNQDEEPEFEQVSEPETEEEPETNETKVKVTPGSTEAENVKEESKTSPFNQESKDKKEEKETVFEVTASKKKQKDSKTEEEPESAADKKTKEEPKPKQETPVDTKKEDSKEKTTDEVKEEKEEKENPEDQAMIVKADSDAIEKALKKHTSDRDKSMVEADEETIVNKVLSQKKWSKKKKDKEEE